MEQLTDGAVRQALAHAGIDSGSFGVYALAYNSYAVNVAEGLLDAAKGALAAAGIAFMSPVPGNIMRVDILCTGFETNEVEEVPTVEKTLAALIAEKKVSMSVKHGAPESEDMRDMDGWTVTLRYQGRQMTLPFYMGRGHNGKQPTTEDVLDCILSDSTGYDNARGFEDWCSDYGYDTDSRKAERTFKACGRTSKRLHQLFGDDFSLFADAER